MHIYFNFAQTEAQLQNKKNKIPTNARQPCQVVPVFWNRHMVQTGALSFSHFFQHITLSYTWKIKQTERKVAICPEKEKVQKVRSPLLYSRVCSHAAPPPHGGRGLRFLQQEDRVAVSDGLLSRGGAPWGGGGAYRTWRHPLHDRSCFYCPNFFVCSEWSHRGHLPSKAWNLPVRDFAR